MNAIGLFLFLAVAADPAAAPKQALTHEAIFLMERVGAPAVSPDGKWAVAPVTEPAYDEKKEIVDLWIVPVNGSAKPRRLTFTKAAESGPAWSPDSRKLAFSSRRHADAPVRGSGRRRRRARPPGRHPPGLASRVRGRLG